MEDADSEDDNNDKSSSDMNTSRADETESSENISGSPKDNCGQTKEDGKLRPTVSGITENLNNLSIISTNSACSFQDCDEEASKFMLQCNKCKKLTHYGCTQLPAYQISLFMPSGYRRYVCVKCVGSIHEDILENCSAPESTYTQKDPF